MPYCHRNVIYGRVKYNLFCDDPTYHINSLGYSYLLKTGFHPDTNPWIEDYQEDYLLMYGYLKCISIPNNESKYEQLNLEMQHLNLMNG